MVFTQLCKYNASFCEVQQLLKKHFLSIYVVLFLFRGLIVALLVLCILGTFIDLYHQYRVSHIPKLVHRIDSTGTVFDALRLNLNNYLLKTISFSVFRFSFLTMRVFWYFVRSTSGVFGWLPR